jgi:hypothetical protein
LTTRDPLSLVELNNSRLAMEEDEGRSKRV